MFATQEGGVSQSAMIAAKQIIRGPTFTFSGATATHKHNTHLRVVSMPSSTPQDEAARLMYLEWQNLYHSEKPYQVFSSAVGNDSLNAKPTNLVFKTGDEEIIHDVRGKEETFTLDEHGFAFANNITKVTDFEDQSQIENAYLQEVEELIRHEVKGVDEVFFYDWRVCSLQMEMYQ